MHKLLLPVTVLVLSIGVFAAPCVEVGGQSFENECEQVECVMSPAVAVSHRVFRREKRRRRKSPEPARVTPPALNPNGRFSGDLRNPLLSQCNGFGGYLII